MPAVDGSVYEYFEQGTAHLPRSNKTVAFYGRRLDLGRVTAVQTYNDLTTYVNDKASDPTQIWMYNLNENTILADKTVAPALNDDGLWEFTISGNVDKTSENYSVAEYEEQMMYMLNSQGQEPTDFYFTDITLKVTMWPNGFFQKVEVSESYVMVLAGIINSEVTLNSTKGFFFEETSDYNAAAFIGTVSNAA